MSMLDRLTRDDRGAALIEFALISPVLMLMLLGMFDMGYNYYVQSQLQGSIQKAARDSSIESAISHVDEIDARVTKAVHAIAPDATVSFSRQAYASFTDVGQPEDFSDVDGDGRCGNGEPFEDANGNGVWDEDRGRDGMGGARDAVLYIVTVSYRRPFGVTGFIGLPQTFTTEASTVLRNQPYAEQDLSSIVKNCP